MKKTISIALTLLIMSAMFNMQIQAADLPKSGHAHYYAPGEFKKLSPVQQTLVVEKLTELYKLMYPLQTSRIIKNTTETGRVSYVRENPSLEDFLRSHGIELDN